MITTLNEYELKSGKKPETLAELKKIMRKVSNIRGPFYGEFSLPASINQRGKFKFIENTSMWDNDGKMSYTGSGPAAFYVDNINKNFFNELGWEMIDLGARNVKVQKLVETPVENQTNVNTNTKDYTSMANKFIQSLMDTGMSLGSSDLDILSDKYIKSLQENNF